MDLDTIGRLLLMDKSKILWSLLYRLELALGYKVGQEDPGMGEGDRMPDNGKGRMNFLGSLHMAWGAPRWNPAPDSQKPDSLNPAWRGLTW